MERNFIYPKGNLDINKLSVIYKKILNLSEENIT